MTRSTTLILGLVAVLALAACDYDNPTSSSPDSAAVTLGDDATITVDDDGGNNFFKPAHAVVGAGTTVTWTWVGSREHNVVGDGFQSDVMREGSFSHTFDEPGTYSYKCTLHGNMDGLIEVTD